jgi:hypothetical protein
MFTPMVNYKGDYMGKYQIKAYFYNPNGTNDIEIVDVSSKEVIDSMPQALFGVNLTNTKRAISIKRALKHIAVSPVSNGSETIEFLNKYFDLDASHK